MVQSFDEKGLLDRIRNGEQGAWNDFVDCYGRLIYHSIHRGLSLKGVRKSEEAVQDIFQSLFVHLSEDNARRLLKFEGKRKCSLASWIRMIAINYTIDVIRSEARVSFLVEFEEVEPGELEKSWGHQNREPDEELAAKEEEKVLAIGISRLSQEDRNFLELHLTGINAKQLAKIFKMPVNSVYSRFSLIKEKLKKSISNKKS